MARRALLILLLAGCGRIGFDAHDAGPRDEGSATGHDEDGDGFVNSADDCPHLAGAQLDSDGDGVGDACDPQPAVARQRVVMFGTLQAHDQPLALATLGTGAWEQRADGIALTGSYGEIALAVALGESEIQFGFRIDAVTGGAEAQHQFALVVGNDAVPGYIGQLNELGTYRNAAITEFDGALYNDLEVRTLPQGVHTGEATLRMTLNSASSRMGLVAGWLGELHSMDAPTPSYTGASDFVVDINNLDLEVHYVWVVGTR